MTKAAFARALRSSWSTVNNWERHGVPPRRESLAEIAAVLRLKPDEKARLQALLERGGDRAEAPPGSEREAPAASTRMPAPARALEDLLTRALVPGRHTIVDASLTLAALGDAAALLPTLADPERAARAWLDAAAALRSRNERVTAPAIAVLAPETPAASEPRKAPYGTGARTEK